MTFDLLFQMANGGGNDRAGSHEAQNAFRFVKHMSAENKSGRGGDVNKIFVFLRWAAVVKQADCKAHI